jgi:hypothetical protein
MALADFNKAVDELSGLLRDHQRFGTYDSEVAYQVDQFYTQLFDMEDMSAPILWQIYTMPGSKALSKQLDLAVKNIITAFDEMTIAELKCVNKRKIYCRV